MDYVAIDIEIDQDTNPLTEWITADPVPASVHKQKLCRFFQGDLTAILMDFNEAHGWYELRNKRFAKERSQTASSAFQDCFPLDSTEHQGVLNDLTLTFCTSFCLWGKCGLHTVPFLVP